MDESKEVSKTLKFFIGGLAGMGAALLMYPLELIKTRLQVSEEGGAKKEYKNSLDVVLKTVRKEGPVGMYRGIGASIFRQATYSTSRFGIFSLLNDTLKENDIPITVYERLIMGMIAGGVAGLVSTPTDVVLIRMILDGRLPPEQRRNYKNVPHALMTITRDEGPLTGLWRGGQATVIRSMVLNMSQLATYAQSKNYYKDRFNMEEGIPVIFYASMTSALVSSVVSLPCDIAKTRLQNMKVVDGKPTYNGFMDVLIQIISKEGPLALWKGFNPYITRLGLQSCLTFLLFEEINTLYASYVLGKSGGSSGF